MSSTLATTTNFTRLWRNAWSSPYSHLNHAEGQIVASRLVLEDFFSRIERLGLKHTSLSYVGSYRVQIGQNCQIVGELVVLGLDVHGGCPVKHSILLLGSLLVSEGGFCRFLGPSTWGPMYSSGLFCPHCFCVFSIE